MAKFKEFVLKHKPHTVAVAPVSMKARNLKLELMKIIEELYNVDISNHTPAPFVMFGNLHISSTYSKSRISDILMKDMS